MKNTELIGPHVLNKEISVVRIVFLSTASSLPAILKAAAIELVCRAIDDSREMGGSLISARDGDFMLAGRAFRWRIDCTQKNVNEAHRPPGNLNGAVLTLSLPQF